MGAQHSSPRLQTPLSVATCRLVLRRSLSKGRHESRQRPPSAVHAGGGAGRRQQFLCSPQPPSARTPPNSQRSLHSPLSEAQDGSLAMGAQHSLPWWGQRPSRVVLTLRWLLSKWKHEARQRPPSAAHVGAGRRQHVS